MGRASVEPFKKKFFFCTELYECAQGCRGQPLWHNGATVPESRRLIGRLRFVRRRGRGEKKAHVSWGSERKGFTYFSDSVSGSSSAR